MATRVEFPSLPPELSALPFLFMTPAAADPEWDFNAALSIAAAAESAVHEPGNSRRRIAFLLCETGCQYARRVGDSAAAMPLSRAELARTLGIGLGKVKRILALLVLSGVVALDGDSLRILDWRRLSSMGGYQTERLGFELPEEDDASRQENGPSLVTGAGDQAYFG